MKNFSADQTDYAVNVGLGALFKVYGVLPETEFILIESWEAEVPVFEEAPAYETF